MHKIRFDQKFCWILNHFYTIFSPFVQQKKNWNRPCIDFSLNQLEAGNILRLSIPAYIILMGIWLGLSPFAYFFGAVFASRLRIIRIQLNKSHERTPRHQFIWYSNICGFRHFLRNEKNSGLSMLWNVIYASKFLYVFEWWEFCFLRDYFHEKKFLVVSFYGFSSKHFNTFSSQTFSFLAESTHDIKENFVFFFPFRFHGVNLSYKTIIILKSGTVLNIIIIQNNRMLFFACLSYGLNIEHFCQRNVERFIAKITK